MPRKSLKKIIEDAMEEVNEVTIDQKLKEELKACFRNEDEVVIYSNNLVEVSEPIYKLLKSNIKHRRLNVMKNKAIKLEGSIVKTTNRFLIEGPDIGQELEVYAKINGLKIVKMGENL
ncbi:MAG: hypothetical protein N3D72_02765 [Candidatus Methanomethyliaceae archaeon]|nr:hypothetical protein [Candidatus Methanomethyliaceae archaeon]